MSAINTLLLLGGLILFISVLATSLARFGFPLLFIFLVVGMLAGENGPGKIEFDDFGIAFFVGNLALAVILLDGGLRTRFKTFRVALWPALSLASIGVLISAALMGAFITVLLGVDWRYGLLLGAIVGSTDAAAVFSQLRQGGVALNQRVAATLEIESGTNDPMAIFLVLFLLESLSDTQPFTWTRLVTELVLQFGVGACGGIVLGYALSYLVERIRLVEGLYALLIVSGGLIAFAAINNLGGSGFLGIYLLGLVVGNRPNHASEHVFRVMDGLAWLAQAGMFLILGMLVTPAELWSNAFVALLIALFLILVARPIATFICLQPFRFPWREQVFVGWVGLRGAVPVVLSIFPLMAALDGAKLLFDITFAVVLVSLLLQGTTISLASRLLGLRLPKTTKPVDQLQIEGSGPLRFVMSQFKAAENSRVIGHGTETLPKHKQVRCVAVTRDDRLIYPDQSFVFHHGDKLHVMHPARYSDELAELFSKEVDKRSIDPRQFFGNFVINGHCILADLATAYGVEIEPDSGAKTLADFIESQLKRKPVEGDKVHLGALVLRVRSLRGGQIKTVGLRFDTDEGARERDKSTKKNATTKNN